MAGATSTAVTMLGAVIASAAFAVATPAASAQSPVVGTWRVADLAGTAVAADAPLSLTFEASGRLEGNGGCNRFGGSYTLAGADLTIGPLMATRRGCEEAVMAREAAMLAILGDVDSIEQAGDELRLVTADGRALVLRRG